jgi:undecaprenyl-diphosphatase
MTMAKTVWGFIKNRDDRVMRRMNSWKAPRWVRFWMLASTRMGDGWLWYSLGLILLVVGGPERYAAVSLSSKA